MIKNEKNKKGINYFLIPTVILIWGFIALRILSFSKVQTTESIITSNNPNLTDSLIIDTINIYANYRDPFKQSSLNGSLVIKSKEAIKPIQTKTIPHVIWPEVSYQGSIKSKGLKQFVLITVNGKKFVTERNMEITGIKIIEIFQDSIKVCLEREHKTILKSNL